jgi:outer membrane protein TolC
MRRCLLCLAVLACAASCQRPWYRRDADRETYAAEAEHEDELRWPVARTNITPPPGSRLFDPFNPDYPPQPPDDAAAQFYMLHPDGQPPARSYHRDGDALWIEDPSWRSALALDDDGNLVLSPERAVELGLLHSREYQQALENLYLTALTLTLDRYDFALHWFGTNNTTYSHFGSSDTELSTLTTASHLGFSRSLAAGGQLLVDFANSFVFTFTPSHTPTLATSNLAVTLVQPLLRNAGRRVRLEGLTQSERNVLYAVRDFARFRKQFYVNLTTTGGRSGYLGLLFQVQTIRNLEANLKSTEQNLRLHEALFALRTVSTVEVDQAFQKYQQGRLSLIQARSILETSLDIYKNSLGLPPDLPVKLDDSILEPFQLAAPELEKLQGELERSFADYADRDEAPPLASLQAGYKRLSEFQQRLAKLTDLVDSELERWRNQPTADPDPAQAKREEATRDVLARALPGFRADLSKLARAIEREDTDLTGVRPDEIASTTGLLAAPPGHAGLFAASALIGGRTGDKEWKSLQNRIRDLIASAGQLYVVQTQVRVYLIQLRPIPYSLDEARTYARANRLDLMNQRGQVVDAWRKIEVTASAVMTGLDLHVTANIATPPDSSNPVDFRASASQYTVGVFLDSPLNRKAERNLYRASLIHYQQARRSFMALDDQIHAAVRLDIRQLETERANFAIARLLLIAAARQLEGARDRLLVSPNATDTTGTQNVLLALDGVLQAKSALISSWINYESGLAQLLLDMDALRLDSRGLPEHESRDTPTELPAPRVLPTSQRCDW